jgi:hypothetical protein
VEDPKYWVKRCRELETGERRIIKLVFYENFPIRLGPVEIDYKIIRRCVLIVGFNESVSMKRITMVRKF